MHGGALSEERPPASFRLQTAPEPLVNPTLASLCIFMNSHMYELLKSGHLTHPHLVHWDLCRFACEVAESHVCCAKCPKNVLLSFSRSINPWAKGVCVLPFPLPALPAPFLLPCSFLLSVNRHSTAWKQRCEAESKSSFLFSSPSYISFPSLFGAGTVWGNSSGCYARSQTRWSLMNLCRLWKIICAWHKPICWDGSESAEMSCLLYPDRQTWPLGDKGWGKGKHPCRNTNPCVEVIRRLLQILQRPLHELECVAVNTGAACGERQKKTSLSQQEIWSLAAQRRNTQRPRQEKLHLTRHPHLRMWKIRAACIYLCANLRGSAKYTNFAVCAFLNVAQTWLCLLLQPPASPLKTEIPYPSSDMG